MAIIESARVGALLERDELLDGLRTALADAQAGHGALLLVGGEAGVGKTSATRLFF
jgi:predicted ATPase